MFRYAQIDENGRVFTVGEHSAELKHERAISIPPGFDPWGKRWNGADWEEYEPEPAQEWPDKAQADMDYLKMMAMQEAMFPAAVREV